MWTQGDRTVHTSAAGIDERGRVAGCEHLTFDAVSPGANVAVGSAVTFVDGYPNFLHAAYWPGTGARAPMALPHPAGASPDSGSSTFAASDDDRVGGTFYDWETMKSSAVVWSCASKQAYVPK
ncbi:hypothetical protein AB0B01_03505 [Streptomyces sp. NPDC044571]|uniref:hypothetical protein n=1 Tax=Streptomyces sp. NPDC044571 TaxID=3155371 RepID=UPI0033DF2758